jgi:serine/threonine protein phosphatase PrpC
LFDLSLEEADFSQVTANANALMSQLRPLTTPSPPPHSSDDVEPLLASPNNDQNSPSIEDTPEPLMSFPTPESPPLDPKKKKKCVRWSSAVFCARGVREKNEDTFYISDDAAEGIGYSSQAPHSDNQGRTVGSEAEDGTTSHATGGGSTPLNASKWDIRKAAKAGRTPIGYFGVYDGHCGKQSANMQALELHTDIFRELESWINMPDDDSQEVERRQAREAAISRAFLAHDSRYLADAREKGWYAGSTAVVGLVIEGGRKVMVANLGDSGAVIVRREIGPKLFSLPSPTNMKEGDHDEDDEDEEGKVEEGKAEEPIVSLTTTVTVEHVITTEQSTVVSYSSLEMREDVERREWNNALAAESSYEAVLLSEDHKPNRPDEKERIEAARGWVTEEKELFMGQLQMMDLDDPFIASRADKAVRWITISRVCQELAVSRAFGDPDFKGFGPSSHTEPPEMLFFPFPDDHPRTFCADLVLATPEVREHTLEEGDEFLILATDGLWDVLAPQEACQAIRRFKVKYQLEGKDPSGDLEALCLYFAEELTRLALRLGSADNITVTVVAFEYE